MSAWRPGERWGPPGEELLAEHVRPGLHVLVFSNMSGKWHPGTVSADGVYVEFHIAGKLCRKRLTAGSACFKACTNPTQVECADSPTDGRPGGGLDPSALKGRWFGPLAQKIEAVGNRFVYEDGTSDLFTVTSSSTVTMHQAGARLCAELRGGCLAWDDGDVWTRHRGKGPAGRAVPPALEEASPASSTEDGQKEGRQLNDLRPAPADKVGKAPPKGREKPGYLQSAILQDGTYMPGEYGMVTMRARNAAALFEKHPELLSKFEAHPCSWRFQQEQVLRFDDKLTDGFRARFAREILLIDARTDQALEKFMQEARLQLEQDRKGEEAAVLRLAGAVSRALGGQEQPWEVLWDERMADLNMTPVTDLPIGQLMEGRFSDSRFPGCGVCRHRSLLFKYACDHLGVAQCAVANGVISVAGCGKIAQRRTQRGQAHMWNVVRVDGRPYLIDCMFDPDRLLTAEGLVVAPNDTLTYHRQGGRSGLHSLDSPGPTVSEDYKRRPSLNVLGTSKSSSLEWFALLKANFEAYGLVEALRDCCIRECDACGRDLTGLPCLRIRHCTHTFHIDCLKPEWDSGICPVCSASFVLPP